MSEGKFYVLKNRKIFLRKYVRYIKFVHFSLSFLKIIVGEIDCFEPILKKQQKSERAIQKAESYFSETHPLEDVIQSWDLFINQNYFKAKIY